MRMRRFVATVIIGKSALLREGIARILRSANFRTMTSVSCIDDLPPGTLQPQDLLVLMIHTGSEFEAVIEQLEFVRDRNPGVRIAIVADHYRLDEMTAAFRAGANGYFVDVMTCDVFIKSIELMMMGETVFPQAPLMSFVLESGSDNYKKVEAQGAGEPAILVTADDRMKLQLSPREKSILECLIEGDSNKSIARKIDVAEATVKVHVKAILRKIRVQNRTQAAIWAINHSSLAWPGKERTGPSPPAVKIGEPPCNKIKLVSDINQTEASPAIQIPAPLKDQVEVRRIGRLPRGN
jgi:DNA-binding NarL/FixJ family response regulator